MLKCEEGEWRIRCEKGRAGGVRGDDAADPVTGLFTYGCSGRIGVWRTILVDDSHISQW